MKKLIMSMVLGASLLTICSCDALFTGSSVTFDAFSLGTTAVKEEKTTTIKGYEFVYYDVCRDQKGYFVLQSNEAWICCKDIQFGLSFFACENVCFYDTTNAENMYDIKNFEEVEHDDSVDGVWIFSSNKGSVIRAKIDSEVDSSPYNIGLIKHWC